MNKSGIHCIVRGKVQGVFYRASTQRKACELNLTGWVRNLPDGRVELQAFGETEQLKQLYEWLWQGPPLAKIITVESKIIDWQEHIDFSVER